jgi:hypothetical protein
MDIPAVFQPALIVGSILAATSVVWGPGLYIGWSQERRKREQQHAERLRALELGTPVPGTPTWWTPPRLAAAMGVFVPLGAMMMAMFATIETRSDWFPFVIWPAAGAVGITAVIGGTVLASRLGGTEPAPTASADAFPNGAAKPRWHDPDALDVVARRG